MPSAAAPPTPARALRSTEKGSTEKATTEGSAPGGPVTDEAIRALGGAIHSELRESLGPEDIVRLATDLLGRVLQQPRGFLRHLRARQASHGAAQAAGLVFAAVAVAARFRARFAAHRMSSRNR